MLTPGKQDLTAYAGGTFDPVFTFYTDAAQTTPFNLTGYTVEMDIGAPASLVLLVGSGLTITTPTNGQVAVKLTPTQTTAVAHPEPQGTRVEYFMKFTDGSGNVTFPVHGHISFVDPYSS